MADYAAPAERPQPQLVYCGEINSASESGLSIKMGYWLPPHIVARHGKVVPPAPGGQRD